MKIGTLWRRLALAAILALGVLAATQPAAAALATARSDALSGQAAPDFWATTLDGKPFQFASFAGRPVVINFFASWCTVCEVENDALEKVHARASAQGVEFLGVLVDSVETPDTVAQAREALAKRPPPYPVIEMVDSLRRPFRYEGFPALVMVRADGLFSSTLVGFHSADELNDAFDELAAAAPHIARSNAGKSSGAVDRVDPSGRGAEGNNRPWERNPWAALVPRVPQQWHPLVVHFPIALLILEAALALLYWRRPSEGLRATCRFVLWGAAASFLPALLTGLHDVGRSFGILKGLEDRLRNLFVFRSSISLHVLFAIACIVLTIVRLAFCQWTPRRDLTPGARRLVSAALQIIALWTLLAATQIGGALFHP